LERVVYDVHEQIYASPKPNWHNQFYRVAETIERNVPRTKGDVQLYQNKLYLTPNKVVFNKSVYSLQDLMAEIGGFAKSLMFCI